MLSDEIKVLWFVERFSVFPSISLYVDLFVCLLLLIELWLNRSRIGRFAVDISSTNFSAPLIERNLK